jgi:hypothetical protein
VLRAGSPTPSCGKLPPPMDIIAGLRRRGVRAGAELKAAVGLGPRRLLFEHLPKCAGTSVRVYLGSQYPERLCFATKGDTVGSIREFQAMPEQERFKYRFVTGHNAHKLAALVHPDMVKVTILRDPVERMISHHAYVKEHPEHYLHRAVVERLLSLADYVTSGLSDELLNHCVCLFAGVSPQEALADPAQTVDRAYEVLRGQYAVVGIVEKLELAMDRIRAVTGIREPFPAAVHNKSRSRPAAVEVEPDALRAIRETNALDITLYERVSRDVAAGR